MIFHIDNLKIYSEDRIGVVGINGVGKTTLINILSQKLEPDEGWVKLSGSYSYISQMEPPEKKKISPEMASKLGVPCTWQDNMSGGEQTRFKLAQSFDNESPMIFADEPTSNMDLEGIELLETMLAQYRGGLVVISHDRSFLDKLVNKVLAIEEGNVKLYNGNYSQYSVQKANERERAKFEYQQYVNEKKRLEGVIVDVRQKVKSVRKTPKRMGNSEARLHKMGNQKAKVSLERAIKSVETRIEQLEVKERPVKQEIIKLDIADSKKIHNRFIIEGKNISKEFSDKVIFQNAEFNISNGAKVALIGPNGCGKSTILKMIMDKDPSIKITPGAKIGYFSQDMNIIDENLSILENVMEGSIYQETLARILLSRLLFRKEDVYKKVGVLSGGERVKTSFAKILLQDINLLILDEPTNYMDISSLEAIEEALRNYDSTLLFVSHDRRFISSVADHIMTIENQKIKIFPGNYGEYLENINRVSNGLGDIEKQIFILQNRLSEIIGRLSLPSKKDNLQELDLEYYEVLGELKKLKGLS